MSESRNRPRLLFTGGGGAGTEALFRLLSATADVHFADADPDTRPASVPITSWHRIPFAAAPDFIDGVKQLCGALGVDLLVPGVDEELLPIAEARTTLGCEVLLPAIEFVVLHLDKLASNRSLRAFGIPVPETEALVDRDRVSLPCIVKPRRGRGSRNVAIVNSEDELCAHVVGARLAAADFIVQELLVGQEYTVTMVADRAGRLRAAVPVRVDLKRGITLRAETDDDAAVMAACAAIHAAQPVAGCFNIQVMKTVAGVVMPFEINPRISTTACLALAAGVDFVNLSSADSRAVVPGAALAPFQTGLRLRRSWLNEFSPS